MPFKVQLVNQPVSFYQQYTYQIWSACALFVILVRSLMDDVCLCQRHFERKFKHYTGFTPKEYSRIVKFKNAVELLRITTSANLLTTAVDAGYYDLVHCSKEIKSMSGNTPASFLSLTVPEETTLTYIEPQR